MAELMKDFLNLVNYDLENELQSAACRLTMVLSLLNEELKSLLRNKGIKHISSILYISEKNGVID
jgi:hypothetical protein